MSEEELTDEDIRIMREDVEDLSNSLWATLRTYDVENKDLEVRHGVLLNSLTTVSANLLRQLGNEYTIPQICEVFWGEVLMKIKSLMNKEDSNADQG